MDNEILCDECGVIIEEGQELEVDRSTDKWYCSDCWGEFTYGHDEWAEEEEEEEEYL